MSATSELLSAPPPKQNRSRQTLAVASWLMVAWVVLGYITTLPSVDRWATGLEQTPSGRAIEGFVLILVGATGLLLWVAALWHAATHTEKGSLGRVGLLVVLVAGNFVAGFLYYFLHVVWREDRPSSISV